MLCCVVVDRKEDLYIACAAFPMSSARPAIGLRPSQEQLLSAHTPEEDEMTNLGQRHVKSQVRAEAESQDTMRDENASARETALQGVLREPLAPVGYKVYKRRWFGLVQLILLNIIVSWDV